MKFLFYVVFTEKDDDIKAEVFYIKAINRMALIEEVITDMLIINRKIKASGDDRYLNVEHKDFRKIIDFESISISDDLTNLYENIFRLEIDGYKGNCVKLFM